MKIIFIGVYMCASLQENFAYEFILAFQVVPSMSYLDVLLGAASRIYSKQHAASLSNSFFFKLFVNY